MARFRVLPHRPADPSAVNWSSWKRVVAGVAEPVQERLEAWDYDQELVFSLDPTFDATALFESTGIEAQDMEVVLAADCKSVQRRFLARSPLVDILEGAASKIDLAIPAGAVAQELTLSAHLLTARDIEDDESQRAAAAGSRLAWSATKRVVLEGHGGRFPTEAVSFAELGLEGAAWSVRVTVSELNDSFAGCVRLLLNTDHTVGQGLASMDPSVYAAVGSFLRIDIIRQCILAGTRLATEVGGWDIGGDEDSFGFVVGEMAAYYVGKDLGAVAELTHTDPARFERVLQDRVGVNLESRP